MSRDVRDAMDDVFRRGIESLSKVINAEVAALAINDELFVAVRKLGSEQALLKQRYVNREITKDEYVALWNALMNRTPIEVILASIKCAQAMSAALSKTPGTTGA
jgi:hypothetical protein